jgi:hypothetical protein
VVGAAELLDIFGITVAPAVAVTTVEASVAGEPARYPSRSKRRGCGGSDGQKPLVSRSTFTPTRRCVAHTGA